MEIIDWQIMSCGINAEIKNGFILYGASGTGAKILMLMHELGLSNKILAVIDSDEKKWGLKWMGYKISSSEIINNISSNAIIIIASIYIDEIFNFLQNYMKCKNRICSSFSFRHAIHYEIMNCKSNYILKNKEINYKKNYKLWKDNLTNKNILLQQKEYFEMIKCITENPISILLCGIQKTGNTSLKESFDGNKCSNVVCTRHVLYFDEYTLHNIKEILSCFNNRKIKIISGIRTPIERIISQKWEHMSIPFLYNDVFISNMLELSGEHFITELISYEKNKGKKYDCTNCFYLDIADWFKDHIEKVFGINIFDYDFDKEKGYTIIEKNNVSIFLYRLDKLDKIEIEIGKFIGDYTFKLKKYNLASKKNYILAYREYIKRVKIKKSIFNSLVDSIGMTHFYTDEEYREYKEKWSDRLI